MIGERPLRFMVLCSTWHLPIYCIYWHYDIPYLGFPTKQVVCLRPLAISVFQLYRALLYGLIRVIDQRASYNGLDAVFILGICCVSCSGNIYGILWLHHERSSSIIANLSPLGKFRPGRCCLDVELITDLLPDELCVGCHL
jgi:hypothetical protein